MAIKLKKAVREDCVLIHAMQIKSFAALLDKYQDFDLSPGNETLELIVKRFEQAFTTYYIIQYNDVPVGAIHISHHQEDDIAYVSPVFILPEYRGKGIAQETFHRIESEYETIAIWRLNTIKEEKGNCHLYEKLGYIATGEREIIKNHMTLIAYEKVITK